MLPVTLPDGVSGDVEAHDGGVARHDRRGGRRHRVHLACRGRRPARMAGGAPAAAEGLRCPSGSSRWAARSTTRCRHRASRATPQTRWHASVAIRRSSWSVPSNRARHTPRSSPHSIGCGTGGSDACLVIVGKQGWMMDDLAARLRAHPERETRLFWFESASDELLGMLYGVCNGAHRRVARRRLRIADRGGRAARRAGDRTRHPGLSRSGGRTTPRTSRTTRRWRCPTRSKRGWRRILRGTLPIRRGWR